ncbi:MAG: hypothetical protein K9N29_06750 [Candidatus Marinimicrobia bacterium]|nr:hypothetical protein [Candidatus Neomarinimicrobiota bacterium]
MPIPFGESESQDMLYWNTRVVRKYDKTSDKSTFEIHEVHYDDNHQITAWTESAVGPFGETLAELKEDIKHFIEAVQKPILELEHHADRERLVEVRDKQK